jgi:hypothetical protein
MFENNPVSPVIIAPDNLVVNTPDTPVTDVNAAVVPVTACPLIVPVTDKPEPIKPEPTTVKLPETVVLVKLRLVA